MATPPDQLPLLVEALETTRRRAGFADPAGRLGHARVAAVVSADAREGVPLPRLDLGRRPGQGHAVRLQGVPAGGRPRPLRTPADHEHRVRRRTDLPCSQARLLGWPSSRSVGPTSAARGCAPGSVSRSAWRGTCSASRSSTGASGGSRRPRRMTGPDAAAGFRVRRVLPFVAAGLGMVFLVLAWGAFQGSEGFAYDYAAYDAAARRLVTSQPLYLPTRCRRIGQALYEGLYLYPPPVALALHAARGPAVRRSPRTPGSGFRVDPARRRLRYPAGVPDGASWRRSPSPRSRSRSCST